MKKIFLRLVVSIVVFTAAGISCIPRAHATSGVIYLRMQSHTPLDQAHRSCDRFIQEVDALSGGNIKITLYPIGTLVPMEQLLEGVGNRVVDIASVAEGYWHKAVPVSIIGQGLPFAFKDNTESNYFMFQKGFVNLLRKGYEKQNIYVIPYEPYNTGLMTKVPIRTVKDLKGLKLRSFGIMQKWLDRMGASTVSISGDELYTALATGVVEGAHWGDAFLMYEMRLHQLLKNYMLPEPIIGSWSTLWINLDVWKKLTDQQRAAIEAAALSAGGVYNFNDTRTRSKMALKDMQKNWNIRVNVVPEEEVLKMRKTAMMVWNDIADNKDPLCREAIDLLYEFLNEVGDIEQ
jgi:TRAP-type C4-dicarboxylate transport system substrate-binding protein